MLLRLSLGTLAALLFASGGGPAGNGGEDDTGAPVVATPSWRVVHFRGRDHFVPPGVVLLAPNVLLLGHVEIEIPRGVDFSFNEKGETVFALSPDEPPHPWVLRVGRKSLVAGRQSRIVVPLPSVGPPRFVSSPFTYRVATPREFLDQAWDLGDPLDASPFR